MSKYTTGELAKLCGVSVRTVQFYDTRGLLPPTELTEGGRRLCNDGDLIKMRLICMLKALGLNLDSIQGILGSEQPGNVLNLLLDEQTKQLSSEIKERQKQLEAIKIVKDSIRDGNAIPVNSITDIEHMMENKKGLRKVHGKLIGGAVLTTIPWWGTIAMWIARGSWIPFAIYTPIHLLLCMLLVRFLHKNTKYVCPACNRVFRPPFNKFWRTSGNKTRHLTCTECGHAGYCIEVHARPSRRKRNEA